MEDGADHVKLADRIVKKPRPISAEENGILQEGGNRFLGEAWDFAARRDAAEKVGQPVAAQAFHNEYLRVRAARPQHRGPAEGGARVVGGGAGA